MTNPETVWLALSGEFYQIDTANSDPKAAAQEHFEQWGGEPQPVTVQEFQRLPITDMLPDHLLGDLLDNLGESLCEQFCDGSAEAEMINALFHTTEGNPVRQEFETVMRPVLEAWWWTHAAAHGVKHFYRPTSRTQTFPSAELQEPGRPA